MRQNTNTWFIIHITIIIQMNKLNEAKFLLRLTLEERKKLKTKAVQLNTTMNSLIRQMITSNKTLNDII